MPADEKKKRLDRSAPEAYTQAKDKTREAENNRPRYENTHAAQLETLRTQLSSRPAFSYDVNADALYRQYREQYDRQGRLAMEDTMGRAQAMTGGYGNSYAQTAAQQTYQNYLGQLNDRIPELYALALERYRMEEDKLGQDYGRLVSQEQREYDRYRDSVSDYYRELSALRDQENLAYDREYARYLQDYKMAEDAFERLTYLMEHLDYEPTEEELKALGFTPEQIRAFLK